MSGTLERPEEYELRDVLELEEVGRLYAERVREVTFGRAVPMPAVEVEALDGRAAELVIRTGSFTEPFVITLDPAHNRTAGEVFESVCHELAHLWRFQCGHVDPDHGPAFDDVYETALMGRPIESGARGARGGAR